MLRLPTVSVYQPFPFCCLPKLLGVRVSTSFAHYAVPLDFIIKLDSFEGVKFWLLLVFQVSTIIFLNNHLVFTEVLSISLVNGTSLFLLRNLVQNVYVLILALERDSRGLSLFL